MKRFIIIVALVLMPLAGLAADKAKAVELYRAETAWFLKYEIGNQRGEVKFKQKKKPSKKQVKEALKGVAKRKKQDDANRAKEAKERENDCAKCR